MVAAMNVGRALFFLKVNLALRKELFASLNDREPEIIISAVNQIYFFVHVEQVM